MSQTAQAVVQNLVDRAVKLGDRQLAADIRAFAAQRQFGLVFEHNRPERLRLYGKPIMKGDVVQVLPERGKKEDSNSQLLWLVNTVRGGVADLKPYQSPSYDENECEPRSVAVDDVVPVAEYDQPIYAGLKETGRVERGGDKPYQVVINGENYHSLETLAFAYAGKVDCIYIDPPYNTGARDWKYNNDYVDGSDAYRHSKWLAFMERRLKLAKQLLNPNDSVLIVTIDEKEYLRLGLLLEQVFPEAHIQMVSIVINPNGVARDKEMYRLEEYAFYVYVGDAGPSMLEDPLFTSDINQRKEIADDAISRSKRGVRWEWLMRGGSNSDRLHSPGCFYPVYIDPKKKRIVEVGDSLPIDQHPSSEFDKEGLFTAWPIARGTGAEKVWQMNPGNLRKLVVQGLAKVGAYDRKRNRYSILYLGKKQRERIERGEILIVGRDDNNIVELEESEEQQILKAPKTIWNRQAHNAGEYGSRLVRAMLPQRVFPYPKSLYAVEDALKTVTKDKRDALIVDFFSGSGTTAHAVMRLNHQDGGHRCSISITNNEVSEDETKKLIKRGLRQGDPDWEALGICRYITKPRVTAAITGKTPEGDSIKGDYKFTDEFPMADGFEENAVFFDLTYEDPDAVELGVAFEEIAPLLWLRAGSRGSIIKHEQPGFAMADAYAVLFDFASVGAFIDAVKQNASIGCAYVITDDTARYASVKAQLPGLDVVRLYENYLQSFKIAAEDAVR